MVNDQPSAAKPRRAEAAPRTEVQVLAELRGLGGLVLEQALLDQDARPLQSLVDWFHRLAEELGIAAPPRARNYSEMLRAIVSVSRAAEEGSTSFSAA